MNPLVSIIIPTYNRANLIGETLNSIKAQTYTNWECIVVDDGSTDQSDRVLEIYCKKDHRFQFYNRPEKRPKGANACRNYGFKKSKGVYILFFDSDDFMLKTKLELQLNYLYNTEFDASITRSFYYNFKTKNAYLPWRKTLNSPNLLFDFMTLKSGWQTGDVLWNKGALNDISFNEKLQSSQDWEFHIKAIVLEKNFIFKDQCMSYIRHTPNSIKNNVSIEKIWSDFMARKSICKFLTKNNKLTNKIGADLEVQFYEYFRQFSYSLYIKHSFSVLIELIKLSFELDTTKNLLFNMIFTFPSKLFKRLFFKK